MIISYFRHHVNNTFSEKIGAALLKANERLFLSDYQVRELQEHYLSTKGWRNDTESITSRLLVLEVDHERQKMVRSRYIKSFRK